MLLCALSKCAPGREDVSFFLLPPCRGGTLHPSSWCGLGWGGALRGVGGASRRLGFRFRNLNGEFGRDDGFRGQSWFGFRNFLTVTVNTDLEIGRLQNFNSIT